MLGIALFENGYFSLNLCKTLCRANLFVLVLLFHSHPRYFWWVTDFVTYS